MSKDIYGALINDNQSMESIHRFFDGDPIPSDARLAKRIANIESDLSKELNSEVLGIIVRAYSPNSTLAPKTSFNLIISNLTGKGDFLEYEIIDKNSPVKFSSISNATSLDKLKSLSGCTKMCSSAIETPIPTGALVRIRYSSNNTREGRIVEIIDKAPRIPEDTDIKTEFTTTGPSKPKIPTKQLVEKICDEKTKFVAEYDYVNKSSPPDVKQRNQKKLKFFTNLNCDTRGSFNERADPEKISKYFTLADLTVSEEFGRNFGIKNTPSERHKKHLEAFAKNCLDKIVDFLKANYPTLPDFLKQDIKFKFSSVYRNPTIDAVAGIRNDSSTDSEEIVTDKWVDKFQTETDKEALVGHNGGTAADLLFPINDPRFQKNGKSGIELLCDIVETLYTNRKELNINFLLIESYGPGSAWIHTEYYLPQSGLLENPSKFDNKTIKPINMWGRLLSNQRYVPYNRDVVIRFIKNPTVGTASEAPQTSLVK